MKIIKVEDPQEKSKICEKILRSLPLWFGIESAILDYIQDVQRMETWVAFESEAIGFISLNKHNKYTAEIHVVGLLPEYHRQRVGSDLVKVAEKSLRSQDFKYLTVKTLSEARAHENYEKTRKFYLKSGFVPIEEFKTLWGEHNPCLMLIKDLGLTANHTAEESINKIHNFWNYFSEQKWNEAETLLHADFVATWPQSKERIVGPKNYINVNRNYPGKHKFKIIHSFPFANKVLMTAWIEADTRQKTFVNSIIEISEGKILNIEEYWAEPFSAPEWRKQWVEIY